MNRRASSVSTKNWHSTAASTVVLALSCAAQFMVVLDISVVNVALPSIQRTLGFDAASLQWVVNAYTLSFAGFLLLGGRIGDLYGRRRIFVLGLGLFSGASLVGGLTTSPGMLIAARAIQGLGAAVLAPATLAILTATFPEGPRRTRAMAAWTAVGLAGGTAGNLIGGALTEYLSWRWILLINVPIGAIAITLAARFLVTDGAHRDARRIDVPGAFVVTLGLAALTLAIAQSRTNGWNHPTTATALTVALLGLAAFVLIEKRFARAPLIPPRLFRSRSISVGNVAMLLAGACLNPMWYFLTLYMQKVLHYGPLLTGIAFLPHTVVGIAATMRLTPWLMRYLPARTLIIIGSLVASAGFWWQSTIAVNSGYFSGILGPAIVFSLGNGLLNTPLTTTVTSGVDASDAGAASGVMNAAKQVGGALGLAGLIAMVDSGSKVPSVLAADYGRAFLGIAVILVVVAALAIALPARRDDHGAQASGG